MNLHIDHDSRRDKTDYRSLWGDNRLWWINCLAIERYWPYAGPDLHAARARRDAVLSELIEHW